MMQAYYHELSISLFKLNLLAAIHSETFAKSLFRVSVIELKLLLAVPIWVSSANISQS